MRSQFSVRSIITPLIAAATMLTLGHASFADTPAPSAAPTAGSVTILYKFVAGEDIKYAMTSTSSGMLNIGGANMPMKQTMTADMDQVVESVDKDGDGTLDVSMSNLLMTMSMRGQQIPVPASALSSTAAKFTISMTPQGKMLGIQQNTGASTSGLDFNKMFSPGELGNMAILPTAPVNIGDTWRGSMNMAALGLMTYMKMTLNSVGSLNGSNMANIGVKMYSTFAPKSTVAGATAMSGQINGLGTMAFDMDHGYQTSFNQDMTMNLTLTPPSGAGSNVPAGSGTIDMTSNTTMHLVSVTQGAVDAAPAPAVTPMATPATPAQ